ncbi:Endoglycoceramidase [Polychytrium aggregatum]|uniref:Endoglycoceramidase n=1 Tax=Polychytrium aggregatum TaxID=110093 RepID=UPI0022FDEB53|nr:Endoglycoceramidase [Polychytrium aggregatum]KAI9197354.1 Endoglycoceramidase [Polychytrium aggregatum]
MHFSRPPMCVLALLGLLPAALASPPNYNDFGTNGTWLSWLTSNATRQASTVSPNYQNQSTELIWTFSGFNASAIDPLVRVGPQKLILDSMNRQRLFRGVNVVYKAFPYYPRLDAWNATDSFTEDDAHFLADVNLNIIRLAIMWSGVEPDQGSYNQSYIDTVKGIVEMCARYGIYVLLDLHQDILSEKICGEGLPGWATDTSSSGLVQPPPFPMPLQWGPWSDPIPTLKECKSHPWPNYQLTPAAAKAYQNLYDNKNGYADALAAFWKKVASEFKNYTNVIGYDLLNEPFAGDLWGNPLVLAIEGFSARYNLQPLYEKIHRAIRSVDTEKFIFFESPTTDNNYNGFTQPPGGFAYGNRSIISYHYYHPMPNRFTLDVHIQKRLADAARLNCGLMMTEFDIAKANIGLPQLLDHADAGLQSWLGWEYKRLVPITGFGDSFFNDTTGLLHPRTVSELSRTYPSATAGNLISFNFRRSDAQFTMTYAARSQSVGQLTLIQVQRAVHYPSGVRVSITGPAVWKNCGEISSVISVATTALAVDGSIITVTITNEPPLACPS